MLPPERPLRVAMLVFNETGRGTYFRALGLARGLARRGHHVSLLTMARARGWRTRSHQEDGVEIVEFPDWLWGGLRSGWDPVETLLRIGWLRRRRWDVVHAFEARPTVLLPALAATQQGRAALVMDWCDWFGAGGSVEMRPNPLVRAILRPVESWFEERFRTRADASTVINTVLRDKAVALGVEPDSILMLPNGADRHRLRPLPQDEARQALGLGQGRPLIGYVGSAFPADLALMGAAFAGLHARCPEARLLRLGQHRYPLAPHLQESGAVIEPGRLSDEALNQFMAACDLFWLPLVDCGANRGRWPAKLTDYLCVGRPIVATRVGDIERLFEQESLGCLADPTPESVADATLALLQAGDAERERYRATAQRLLDERFNWDTLAEQLAHHYLVTLEGRR